MFVLTDKQKELYGLFPECTTILAEGGGRSGKTISIVRFIFLRALKFPNTDHLIGRLRFSHVKQSICYQTIPKLSELEGINYNQYLNRTDWFYNLPNGSRIWIGGFDDKERTEKILGNEYATLYFNESSQLSYETIEMVLTRLNPPIGVPAKVLIDYNPPSINHWGYRIFHKREFPDGRPVPEKDYRWVKILPKDNPYLSPQYLETLNNMSADKRRRFMDGEYSIDSGTMFRREWIAYSNTDEIYEKICVGVDPGGSVNGDETGIVVAGKVRGKNEYHILDDYSLHGTPLQWSGAVVEAYNKWQANMVCAERNYGGDMVSHTLQTANPNMPVRLVTASRGKLLRAEPVAALYERGLVKHRVGAGLQALEDEMCYYNGSPDQESPNHLDAMVWAMTFLMGSGQATVGFAALKGI